jgi:SAM-dependent methyltransferase
MTNVEPTAVHPFVVALRKGEFDFLDFGCSRGGSIEMAKKLFGARRGLGIDIAEKKVEEATAAGYDAIVYDIRNLPRRPFVRFCVLVHFLEHVPNRGDVIAFLHRASRISKEFVFIRQPYFDADGYLFQNGLKLFWSDWLGHPNTMTTLNFHSILVQMKRKGYIGNFSIHLSGPIPTSAHNAIHAVNSPRNQHHYDPALHPAKPMDVRFQFPVFTEVIVLISKPGIDHYAPFGKVNFDSTVFDSAKLL